VTASRKIGVAVVIAFLAGLLGIAATGSLGFWQLRRAAAKEALQVQVDAAAHATPIEPDRASLQDPASLVFHHLHLRGTWMPEQVVYLDNRPRDGQPGFYVLMPLKIDSPLSTEVIVNRGWTPRAQDDRTRIAPYATPAGIVDVTGVALAEEPRLLELGRPAERSLKTVWQNFDFAAYARASGQMPPAFVLRQDRATNDAQDAVSDDGLARDWPDRGGALQGQIDRHHGYAFQWFALAAAIAALVVFRLVRVIQHDRIVLH
jgi:cytochrome oxidase assembly protein ShyY1